MPAFTVSKLKLYAFGSRLHQRILESKLKFYLNCFKLWEY